MKHCISFVSDEAYAQFIDSMTSHPDWEGVEVQEYTPETDANGNPYKLLTLTSQEEIPFEQELEVNRRSGVIATTFNIEEV